MMYDDPGLSDLLEMFAPSPPPDPREDRAKRDNEAGRIVDLLLRKGIGVPVCREDISALAGVDSGHVHVRIEHAVNVVGWKILGGKAKWGKDRLPLCRCHRTQTYALLEDHPTTPPPTDLALKVREVGGKVTVEWDTSRVSSRYSEAKRKELEAHIIRLIAIWRKGASG